MTKTVCAVLAALALLSGCVAFGTDNDRDWKYEHIDHEAEAFFDSLDRDIRELWSK